jgi:L-malate glycosyltransferase
VSPIGTGTAAPAKPVPRSGGAVRVMHVVYALQPGGMELGVVKLLGGLNRRHVQSSICSTTPAAADMKQRVPADVPIFELRRRAGNDPGLVRDLYRLFRRERPDIVHTHAWGTLVEGLIACRLARVPFVVHGEHGTLQLKGYQRWVQRTAWKHADRLLSVSSRLADRMAEATGFPRDRISTLRNGVDLSRFGVHSRDEAKRALGLRAETVVIGTAARLVPVKDHYSLLNALSLLVAQGVQVMLLIAGEGPLRSDLERTAATLGITDNVRFLGHCSAIDRVLAALDVFVLSSISEGLPNTVLEAMASGVPVVATRVGGVDELIVHGETGLLVSPQSAADIADALRRLLVDPSLRRAMGEAARCRAEREFSLASTVRQYEELYLEMAQITLETRRLRVG